MIRHVVTVAMAATMLAVLTASGQAADNAQQQRMKDCNQQAAGMTGDARKSFMSSCLSGKTAAGNHPNCTPGKSKPCGNSCISLDKTCHK